MDAISEILSRVKLSGALFFNAEFSAPWAVASPPSAELAPALSPGAPHLVVYHLVLDGVAYAILPDGKSISIGPGDVLVLPHGSAHMMTSEPYGMEPKQTGEAIQKILSRDLGLFQVGGGGGTTRFVCGFMACDPHLMQPVLNGLPQIFKVNLRNDSSGRWLESSILHLVDESTSGRAGSEVMLAKLSEALFVDTFRRYVSNLPQQETGWLAGSRDPEVGKCLGLLHRKFAHPWTIAELAKEVGTSRSALAEKFTKYLSEPPMSYLGRWRMHLAARALETTSKGVGEIAESVGYESEASFNRAFKREKGMPPAQYRREQRSSC